MDSPYKTWNQHPYFDSQPPHSFMILSSQLIQSPYSAGDVLASGRDPSIRYRVGSLRPTSAHDDVLMRRTHGVTIFEHPSVRTQLKTQPQTPLVFVQLRVPLQKQYPSSANDREPLCKIPDFQVVPGIKTADQATLADRQVNFVDFSSQDQEVRRVMASRTVFLDVQFPPSDKTMFGRMTSDEERFAERKQQLVWRRITEVVWNAGLFIGGIHPNNVHQGQFGTAYLLVALSALAEKPQRIRDLFLAKQVCQQGVFACSLLFRGRRKSIYLDSFLPLPREQYVDNIFGCSIGLPNQLWVGIIEKAWAKLYGSYYAIEGGQIEQSLHDLTGAHLRFIRANELNFDKGDCWNRLLSAYELGYVVIAEASPEEPDPSLDGTVFTHQYAVVGVYEVIYIDHPVQVIKCRNPWNHERYCFEWSDNDTRWSEVSEIDKKNVGYKKLLPSEFLLSFNDFLSWFPKITIAEISDSASYVYCSQPAVTGQSQYFKVSIFEAGWYSFQLNQTPSKVLLQGKRQSFTYLSAYMSIGRLLSNGDLQWYRGAQSAHRTVFRKHMLPQGEYIVCTEQEFYKEDTYRQATLSVYGEHYCDATIAPQAATVNFRRRSLLSRAQQVCRSIGKNIFEANEVLQEGYLYTAVLNRSSEQAQLTVQYIFC